MSKKLAEGLDRLVLDVKWGSGAFMQTRDDAAALADSLRDAGTGAGVSVTVFLNAMNEPLGCAAGNALEVAEVIDALHGRGPHDLVDLVIELAAAVSSSPREAHRRRLEDGTAWTRFQEMVTAQGGDGDAFDANALPHAPVVRDVPAPRSGTLCALDAAAMGHAIVGLRGGRSTASDAVDPATGFDRILKTGSIVRAGDPVARVHARSGADADSAIQRLLAGVVIS